MSVNLKKRLVTSFFLIILLSSMYFYTFVLIISLILFAVIGWIEFNALLSKIFFKDYFKDKFFKFIFKSISLVYFFSLIYFIIVSNSRHNYAEIQIIYALSISIVSDVGGLVVGKLFKGKKLTKISPKKTISGSIGSFMFSLMLIPIFILNFKDLNLLLLIIITLLVSLASQFGDLLMSFIKRKAKVKDTSDLLPGHGGILDRIDGMLLSIPICSLLFSIF